jgi:3-oxoacyl-(acyl-carrier-protein) synthase
MRRVAINGLGAICALGRTVPETAESLRAGRSGIGPIKCTDYAALEILAPIFRYFRAWKQWVTQTGS